MDPSDWESVRRIYAEGIAGGQTTFETEAPGYAQWDARHHPRCRLVFRADDGIAGWTALSPVSSRAVYSGVAEVSVYVASRLHRQGIGAALLDALVSAFAAGGFWTLPASIFPENEASIALHCKHGFRIVGRRERIAQLHGIWRDTILMERRSPNQWSSATASPVPRA
jgi:phosphinothricin acetyltransferase